MDICLLPQAATVTQLYKELQTSTIGGTPFTFSPTSPFVHKHNLQLVFYKQFNTSYYHLYNRYKAFLQKQKDNTQEASDLDKAHSTMQKHERVRSQAELNQIIRYYKNKHANTKKLDHVTQRLERRLKRMKYDDNKPSRHKGTSKSDSSSKRHDLTHSEIELVLNALHNKHQKTQHKKQSRPSKRRRRTQRVPAVAKQIIIH
jgi:hypothetical protein